MKQTRRKTVRILAKRLERVTMFSATEIESMAEGFPSLSTKKLNLLLPVILDFASAQYINLRGAADRARKLLTSHTVAEIVDEWQFCGGMAEAIGRTTFGTNRRLSVAWKELARAVLGALGIR